MVLHLHIIVTVSTMEPIHRVFVVSLLLAVLAMLPLRALAVSVVTLLPRLPMWTLVLPSAKQLKTGTHRRSGWGNTVDENKVNHREAVRDDIAVVKNISSLTC